MHEVKVVTDPATQKARGFAFVQFMSAIDAAKALDKLNGTTIGKSGQYQPLVHAERRMQG